MLRTLFVGLSRAAWAKRVITGWGFARRAASRFVAGEGVEDALRAVEALAAKGIAATLDHLGENTTTRDEAAQATAAILELLDRIDQSSARANVSIKLSQIGLGLDPALGRDNLARIVQHARDRHNFVRIDMEDSSLTERTLDAYAEMRRRGFDNLGVVIQAYLFRSEQDIRIVTRSGGRVRLCKGAYKESEEVAYPRKQDVDANYDRLAELLLDAAASAGSPLASGDGRVPPMPAIATHDPRRIQFARQYAQRIGLPKPALEFQMLYGIRRDLQEQLAADGYPVRVYVPYGTHWYPYFMRRLAERPANVWFFLSNLARR